MTTDAGVEGFAPIVGTTTGNPEALKYGKLWGEHPEYRAVAPGEELSQMFLQQAKPKPGSTVIDFGCGTGRGAMNLAVFGGLNVTMVDFVRNSLDEDVKNACETQSHMLRFVKKDLEQPLGIAAQYGYCTDVMEHIPTDKVSRVLDNVLQAAEHVFFSISTIDDVCGKLIGAPLHLTIQPYGWWLDQFTKRECLIHWSKDCGSHVLFYVSGWMTGKDLNEHGTLNETWEKIKENVRINCANGWDQVKPYETNDMEVMILGGGPSLASHLEEIRQKRDEGVKLITLNGTYNWALDNGLVPSCQIMVDSREFNARFTKPVHDTCRYLIASQCHPSVFEGLPKDRTMIWHTMFDTIGDIVKEHYGEAYPVPSAMTVLCTGILLLRMLGFRKFHLYGCDSCLAPDKATHHAYAQPENDAEWVVPCMLNDGKVFWCHPWMVCQAENFMQIVRLLQDELEIEIHGDGLLKHILTVGAMIADEDAKKEN